MDRQLHFHAGLAEPKSVASTSSDPEKRSRSSKHKSHRHHDHHDERHSSSRRRHAAKEAVQSAIQIQPPTSFGDLLKQARGSKETSPGHSRKGSVAQLRDDGSVKGKESGDGDGGSGIAILPRKPLRAEDVEKEAKRVKARERDVHAALQSLSDQSIKTARRLDDTYYSILEKMSTLRQTIGTLQELSGLTRELHDNFKSDTTELVEDVGGQLEGFDNFQTQQEQVNLLEERIKTGREKADALATRLAQARERVVARAELEAERQASHNRRLRIFWGTLASIAAVIFSLILFHHFKPMHLNKDSKAALDCASRAKIAGASIPDIAKEAILGPQKSTASESLETSFANPLLTDDDRLRAFDDL